VRSAARRWDARPERGSMAIWRGPEAESGVRDWALPVVWVCGVLENV
jgi:hypothetical protein